MASAGVDRPTALRGAGPMAPLIATRAISEAATMPVERDALAERPA